LKDKIASLEKDMKQKQDLLKTAEQARDLAITDLRLEK